LKKQILLGTTNPAKVNIVRAALDPLSVEILTPADLDIKVDVREDGKSTEENAERKARAYFAEARMPTLAIDGGLHIEGLSEGKQPGMFVRRIEDRERDATDAEVLDHYARELAKIGGEAVGIWRGSIALVISDEQVYADTFTYKTALTSRRRGGVTPGAPLDALTIDPATGRYFSEMTWQERPDLEWVFEFVRQHIDKLGARIARRV
jgi:inosine/xanthosine triphosphate pyrophosphatase family protein